MQRKYNRNDFSGKSEIVNIQGNIIKLKNIELKLVRKKNSIDVLYRYYGDSWDKFITMYKIDGEWFAEKYGVSRESKDEFQVAFEMASNLI